MVVYWSMLIWVFLFGWCQSGDYNPLKSGDAKAQQMKFGTAVMVLFPVIFFAAVRSDVGDTGLYFTMYKNTPDDMAYFRDYVDSLKGSPLFYGSQMIFKCFVSKEPVMWFGLVAIIEGLLVAKFFQKYSPNVVMSAYIFVGSTLFTWLYNGVRQFLPVCILLAMTEWIVKNRWYYYVPVVLILGGIGPFAEWFGVESVPWFLGGIHQSSLLMIPVFFILQGKAWNWRVWVFIVVFTVLAFAGVVDDLVGDVAENSEYAASMDSDMLADDDGANPIRALVAAVPVVMAYFKRKELEKMGDEVPSVIHISANASVVTLALYITSTISGSGVMIGRLTVYTELYSLVLIPWLLLYPYKKTMRELATGVYGAYLMWFVYQMCVAWSMSYGSKLLDLYV